MTNEHLDSLDATLNAARNAWEAERKSLHDRIFALETENALIKGLHADAIRARSAAEGFSTRLLTQFAVVEHVFSEARSFALSAGVNIEEAASEAVERAKALIDTKTTSEPAAVTPVAPLIVEAPHVPA